jgi:hypothetical protein
MERHSKGTLIIKGRLFMAVLFMVGGIFSFASLTPTSVLLISDAQSPPPARQEVAITYPDANQTLPTGTLAMYGTSSDNATTRCIVSALLNDERPYQNVTATGPTSNDDYSKWTFTFDPYYTLIKQGSNELVARIICEHDGGTNSTAFNKMNVTGVQPEELNQ